MTTHESERRTGRYAIPLKTISLCEKNKNVFTTTLDFLDKKHIDLGQGLDILVFVTKSEAKTEKTKESASEI